MINEITILRSIGIILVVFGHSDIGEQNTPAFYSVLEKIVYSFHMPLFIFISGFVFILSTGRKENFKYWHFVKSKIFRLLLPSFIVLTAAFFVRAVLSTFKDDSAGTFTIVNYFKMFFFKEYLPIEFFWFIFTLFNIFLFSGLILYCIKNRYLMLILTLLLVLLNIQALDIEQFYIKYTCEYFFYFWAGCLSCHFLYNKNELLNFMPEKYALSGGVFFLLILIILNTMFPGKPIVIIGSAISGIFMCYFFALFLKKYKLYYLDTIGKYSYQVFLLSWFFHRVVETIGFKILNLSFSITFPSSLILAITGPIWFSIMIEIKIPRMKFAIGDK